VGACGRLQKKKFNERFLVTEQVDMNALCTVIFAFRKRMWAVSSLIVDIASPTGACDVGTTNGTVFLA
jgi:hypothetical protein